MNETAALFPGQGSQYRGMAGSLYREHEEVRALYRQSSEILGYDLYRMCEEGAEADLTQTEVAQPAILTASVAAYTVFRKEGGRRPAYGAGHSLGELSALCCAGVIGFPEAVRIAKERGRLMQQALTSGAGTMAAVSGVDATWLRQICEDSSDTEHMAVIANYNAPTQIVISGHTKAVQEAEKRIKANGGRLAYLKVSSPFHSPLMKPCAEGLKGILAECTYREPEFPVISNVTARPYPDSSQVPQYLYQQITSPVLWQDIIAYLLNKGVENSVEFGPGAVLKGLMIKNTPFIKAFCFEQDREMISRLNVAPEELFHNRQNLQTIIACIAAAVSTRNRNWNDEEYRLGVEEPYEQLCIIRDRAQNGLIPVSAADADKGKELLRRILAAKQLPAEECRQIMAEL